jgi:PAS domain S-box-containing protein
MNPGAYAALAARLGPFPEQFTDPIYVVDRIGRVVFCNHAFAGLVGERAEDIVGKLSLLFFSSEATPMFLRRCARVLVGDEVPPTITTEIRRSGLGTMPVKLSEESLEFDGRIVGRLAIVRQAG